MSRGCGERANDWCRAKGGPCDWTCTTQGEAQDVSMKPYTRQELKSLRKYARQLDDSSRTNRLLATLCQAEAQRDAYKRVIVGLARDKDLGRLIEQVKLYGVLEDDMADYWDALVAELVGELTP